MRGVVWTDIIQGGLLIAGCLMIFFCLWFIEGANLPASPQRVISDLQNFFSNSEQRSTFFSLLVLIIFSASVYPQAIQRIYAARNILTLQRSYRLMFFMPLVVVLPILLIGVSASEWYPGLSRQDSETVIILAIDKITSHSPALSWLLVLFLGAVIAAIMSTIDLALLAMGSTISKDMIARRYPQMQEQRLHGISRQLTWFLIAVMAALAIVLPQSIWALLVLHPVNTSPILAR